MKLRLFLIISVVMGTTTVIVSAILLRHLQEERLSLVDDQLRKIASLLAASEFGRGGPFDFEVGDDLISEELGEDRIGKIFYVHNGAGELLYSSRTAQLLDDEFPTAPMRYTYFSEDAAYRVLNVPLPRKDRFLQVATVLDPSFVSPIPLTSRVGTSIAILLLVLLAASLLLTRAVLKPVGTLATFLRNRTERWEAELAANWPFRLPPSLLRRVRGLGARSDEFAELVVEIRKLLDKVALHRQLTQRWTSQLAHELKTPLTLMRVEAERASGERASESGQRLAAEVDRMSEIVDQFLGWAELESAERPQGLHALEVAPTVARALEPVGRLFPERLRLHRRGKARITANPLHVDQFVGNLVMNALRYSPTSLPVDVHVDGGRLRVVDRGPGIPAEVLADVGRPFNRGSRPPFAGARGSGLGLAWAKTISRLYGWEMAIASDAAGTTVDVNFVPPEASRPDLAEG